MENDFDMSEYIRNLQVSLHDQIAGLKSDVISTKSDVDTIIELLVAAEDNKYERKSDLKRIEELEETVLSVIKLVSLQLKKTQTNLAFSYALTRILAGGLTMNMLDLHENIVPIKRIDAQLRICNEYNDIALEIVRAEKTEDIKNNLLSYVDRFMKLQKEILNPTPELS